jgi:predicted MPP superfamily phosphohydrolase
MLNYFLVASLATLLTHGYFALRLLPVVGAAARRLLTVLLGLNFLLLPGSLVLTLRAAPQWALWSVPLAHVAFADVGFCLLLAAGLLARDVAWAVGRLATGVGAGKRDGEQRRQRRRVLLGGLNLAVGGAAGLATAVGYAIALGPPVVRRVRVPCPKAPLSWAERGLRVAQVSDLHVGPTIRRDYVERLVAAVNALSADVIVITGDLVDGFVSQLRDQVAPLAQLRARHGVYFVTGNHEYFYRAAEWVAALGELGLCVLQDQHQVIEHLGARVLLAGINDPNADSTGDADYAERLTQLLATAPATELRILLAHRPGDAPAAARHGIDVQLSGHLHGGQFFPLTWLLSWVEPFVAGLYRVGDLLLYVNRGAGYWGPPNRLGMRQEITLLELTRP